MIFKVIGREKNARLVRLLRFLFMQKFEKKTAKRQVFAALVAPKDFQILVNFCTILRKSIAAEQLFITIEFQKKDKNFFTPPYCTY